MSAPPSSPRLPSPPPAAEIQIGPKSPSMGPSAVRQAAQIEQTSIDTNAKRRIHPGTKSADMAAGPPLVPLHELDSAFQLQEHLAALHYYHTASHTTPINRDTARLLATPPPGIDKTLWLYELCRFLIAQCNRLIVGFLFDTPPCSASTCPEMRAGEWQFLCAVHDTPKSCCAIDYCCHTLDWAANVVTNPKIFPSRFVVDAHDKNTAVKNLVNVFRRLHRIFAHAWFQHRGVFWSLESQSGLYVFFKTVCDVYDLLPAENYKLPPEAEGLDSTAVGGDLGERTTDRRQQHHPIGPISIAKPPRQSETEEGDYSNMSRTNTRRHIKSSPSVGSAVTTVPEADEDESADLSNKLRGMRISALAATVDEEPELTSIPVMVEHRPVGAAEQPLRPSSVIPPPGTAPADAEQASDEAEVPAAEHEFADEPEMLSQAKAEPEPQPEPQPEAAEAPQQAAEQSALTETEKDVEMEDTKTSSETQEPDEAAPTDASSTTAASEADTPAESEGDSKTEDSKAEETEPSAEVAEKAEDKANVESEAAAEQDKSEEKVKEKEETELAAEEKEEKELKVEALEGKKGKKKGKGKGKGKEVADKAGEGQ
ncbi:hypothetical protein N0V88_003021 [Collariella sp. IMI 366227]|nr:hypothetical protein N0V88_003021 [Collariella sp. IMI 366227]